VAGAGPAAATAPAAGAAVVYSPPVPGEVVERFDAPASPYAAGNRGVDYATAAGTPVVAAAPGVVAFAGAVGGSLHVSVLHDDGIRTTYSFLQAVDVRRGDHVASGAPLGRAATRLHWGARAGDAYVDPLLLLGGGGPVRRARLVPESGKPQPRPEPEERRVLVDLLRKLGRASIAVAPPYPGVVRWAAGDAATAAAAVARDRVVRLAAGERGLSAWLRVLGPLAPNEWAAVGAAAVAARASAPCTPAASAPPPRPAHGRRLAVLVGGFGSSSPDVPGGPGAAVFDVDTAALGYRPDDVAKFSYRGGTTDERSYRPADTHGDIAGSGARLRSLLDRLQAEHPGVPVDLVAHSQGGLVARAALADGHSHGVATLVTLGTPHRGADLAAAAKGLALTANRRYLLDRAYEVGAVPAGSSTPAVTGLAPGSLLLRHLDAHPPPPSVRVVSVAARADAVVPPGRSTWPRARSVTIDVQGVNHHDALPRSPAATREVALAVAGLPPTCRGRGDRFVDGLLAVTAQRLERQLSPLVRALNSRTTAPGDGVRR
jgi:hypothetical protein